MDANACTFCSNPWLALLRSLVGHDFFTLLTMSLIDRVLAEPEFVAAPLVLVDVGAAGGVSRMWRRLASHATVLAFEPDMREAAPLTREQRAFRRWIYVSALVSPEGNAGGTAPFHLTRSPQCSSMLRPNATALQRWAFASEFEVQETRPLPTTTLSQALVSAGIAAPDWIKCDSQGLDLRIFMSLPAAVRHRALMAEFEPGLIDAYHGEDTMPQILAAMRGEPFWLAQCSIEETPVALRGEPTAAWYRRLAPSAPGWGNLRYLRDFQQDAATLDRRALLVLWVFAMLHDQPGYAFNVAVAGGERFGSELFSELQQDSARHVRWAMVCRFPRWAWKRIMRSFP
jgi:FkbM family methyltransferase